MDKDNVIKITSSPDSRHPSMQKNNETISGFIMLILLIVFLYFSYKTVIEVGTKAFYPIIACISFIGIYISGKQK